jgi:prevent-host-death family protein
MISPTDIQSLTDFKRNTAKYMKKIKKSNKPLVLTVNGKAEIVVQDAEAYQVMLDRIERVQAVEAIRKGTESFERREGRPAWEALDELRQKHGI